MKRKMGAVRALGLGVGVAQGCGEDISSVAGREVQGRALYEEGLTNRRSSRTV